MKRLQLGLDLIQLLAHGIELPLQLPGYYRAVEGILPHGVYRGCNPHNAKAQDPQLPQLSGIQRLQGLMGQLLFQTGFLHQLQGQYGLLRLYRKNLIFPL